MSVQQRQEIQKVLWLDSAISAGCDTRSEMTVSKYTAAYFQTGIHLGITSPFEDTTHCPKNLNRLCFFGQQVAGSGQRSVKNYRANPKQKKLPEVF